MDEPSSSFGVHPWRDALRPARHPSLEGWSLSGPRGVVATRIVAAVTPWRRMRGLLGRAELAPHEALLIQPCSQVHSIGMRHTFDAVFCDDQLRVLDVATIPPRRLSRHVRGSACCFELAAGRAAAAAVGRGVRLSLGRSP